MKKLFIFLVSIGMALLLTSCVSTAYAQTDEVYTTSDSNVNVDVVISYGVPVYDEAGFVLYYLYKGWYYYPYWITDRYYFHIYRHPLGMDYYRRWYRPVPRDFHRHFHYDRVPRAHKPHHSGRIHHDGGRMRPHNGNIHNRPSVGHRPSGNHNRPIPNINRGNNMHRGGSMGNSRPMTQPRSSTRNSSGGGHFGGSRMGGRR
jgi:hypothetical protein